MKIKRLIIRNIASIEKGEIDFENGLIDRETGGPASLFLITGDTGSGKSVILDCISMALYGTTPRVKSVNGVKNNFYRNNNGEEISVNDISQYTRIGISWKDECYSELTFSGNDNIDYVARYSLGRTNRQNYRKPEWTLRIGDSEIIENRKDEIRERIQKAVGLSFEQFSRMAMLAQGQFATFLTGRKEERESILEQLTSTGIFSRYGEAITNLYKASKQEYETAQKISDEFRKKILDETTRQQLTEEYNEKLSQAEKMQVETDKLRRRISCTEAIVKTCKDIKRLNDEKARLSANEETAEHRKRITILSLWDSTAEQRDVLSEKIKTSEKILSDRKKLREKKSELQILSEDLSARIKDAEAESRRLDSLRIQIESQESLKYLFRDATAVIAEINRFVAIDRDIRNKEKESIDITESIEELQKTIVSVEKNVKEKSELCMACQAELKLKTSERDSLDPPALRIEKDRLVKRQFALADLSKRLEANIAERKVAEKAEEDISAVSANLEVLSKEAEKATAEYKQSENEKNAAESRYRTMLLSIEENFEAIRHQLVEEHASNCPLCGQSIKEHIHEWGSREYFMKILSPLETEKNKLHEAFILSKKSAEEAMKRMNTTSGILKTKEEDLKKRKNDLSKNEKDIRNPDSYKHLRAHKP